jgi:tetratricopeptide (TPR) repeat protein/DNA-binding XRE family transcriptional regulator
LSQGSKPDFAHRLRALRKARNMTQRELAGTALSVSYVSLLEAGRRTPTGETLRELAQMLGCSVAELTGESDTPTARPPALNLVHGQLALEAGEVDQAREHFQSVLTVPDVDPPTRAEAILGIARAMEKQGRLEEAARAYEGLVQQAVDTPAYLATLQVVISWARCLHEMGELHRAIEVGMGAIEELDRLDAWHSDASIELLATVAGAYAELGDIRQAERLLREGLEKADHMHSPRARAAVLWNSSQLACDRGRYKEALNLAAEALAYFQQDKDSRNAARLQTVYGYILLQQDPPDPVQAHRVLEQALAGLTGIGRGFDRGYVLTELSRARLMQGDGEGAVEAAERSLTELGPEAVLERARAEAALAAALAATGERERSKATFAQAARTLNGIKASRQASRVWAELGNMLADAGDSVAAVEAFRQATASVNIGGGR